ncbi:KOW domain-containing protein [Filifactor villosus]|uniref:KOW domain-containing protein n=1 Tax=Filifactor villosus TaxID=29374 RepID=A0ABV9QND7_9FIRM
MENVFEKGTVVISRAGHDKSIPMVVYEQIDQTRVFVVDGKNRKVEKPKLKNVHHLQKTNHFIDLKPIDNLKDNGEKNAYIRKQLKQIGY